ncbi:MAG: hypothetical protein J5U17_01420 [Candidatus Methanoperedens sp.]|nr:hypothetical protein [Candidatus Methanoperedens sp.]
MISIVCVYNNERILTDYLLKSLHDQTVEFDLIKVDNTSGSFKSASEALNLGGKKAKGKYIMFVHQDVDLSSNTWLEKVEKILDALPNLGIAGVAGTKDEKGVMSVIEHSDPPKSAGEIYIKKPTKVQTLDECLVIIPRSIFIELHFDEKICDDWHLYTVDYCLSCLGSGFDVYAIPVYIYHRCTSVETKKNRIQIICDIGYLPEGYYKTLQKLLNKHKKNHRYIYTNFGRWDTSYPVIPQKIWPLIKAGITYPGRKLQNWVNK